VFTPNGDGENDGFTITSDKLTSLDVVIYNRWGQVVFSWTSLNGSWDGRTISGIASPEGTYFYIAKVVGVDGEESTQKGAFSLLR
jgi:gliding motility-associated-like protein